MAMRDLVTGGAACAVPGSSSSSNPFGALANAILGSSMKAQVLLSPYGFLEMIAAPCGSLHVQYKKQVIMDLWLQIQAGLGFNNLETSNEVWLWWEALSHSYAVEQTAK
ncbi:hypothetical protein IEQ34_011865 [Dendrobium chrysotoxum]|uniref:Uncharacterized protein n=1 Tax=Dendrobium chrysotoxum TaxID=161865 RepID=A0AAV7GSS3_DENCH|nr:hypothetical protein IEQ34_011865 [Dendrobium chrysotoxum]